METIPNEILFHILSYLDLDERADKRRVNKLWNEMIPSLPLTLSDSLKQEIIENMRRISIQIHFANNILYFVYEDEEIQTYTFLDSNENILFDLSMDPNWETMGNYFTNVNVEDSKWTKIKSDLDYIFETEEGMIETYVKYIDYLIFHLPEIKFICEWSTKSMNLDLNIMRNTLVKDVMAVLRNNKKYLIEKNPSAFHQIFSLSMLKGYLNTMDKWKTKIVSIFPKYITMSKELLEKYLFDIIQ